MRRSEHLWTVEPLKVGDKVQVIGISGYMEVVEIVEIVTQHVNDVENWSNTVIVEDITKEEK